MTTYPPSIHINGSSKEDLFNPLRKLMKALKEAAELVNPCYPHMRDYYPQGEAARDNYEAARKELRLIRSHIGDALLAVTDRTLAVHDGGYSSTEKKEV